MDPIAAATGIASWRIVAVLMAVVALLGLGARGGYALARNHYEPRLASANEKIGALTTANAAMQALIGKQNDAVADLQAQAQRRARNAAQAVEQARQQSARQQTRAQQLLLLKPPPGVDQCAAAQAALDDELRHERGGP